MDPYTTGTSETIETVLTLQRRPDTIGIWDRDVTHLDLDCSPIWAFDAACSASTRQNSLGIFIG